MTPVNGYPTLASGYTHISHRGASGISPENTVAAFDCAVQDAGTDVLELDVHATRDGEVVVIHDAAVDRTCDGSALVRDCTLAELQRFDAGYRFSMDNGRTFPFRGRGVRIPLLRELFERYPDVKFNIDVKQETPPVEALVIRTIRAHNAENRVVVGSAHHTISRRLKRLAPDISSFCSRRDVVRFFFAGRTRLPLPRVPHQALQLLPRTRWFTVVDTRLVDLAHEQGLYVHVWTINEEHEMERLLKMGVDGIMTDFPGRLTAVLKRLHEASERTTSHDG